MRPRCTAIFLSSASTETASEQNATDMAQRVFIVHRALVKPWKIVRQLVRQREIHIVKIHIILELRILPTDVVINDFDRWAMGTPCRYGNCRIHSHDMQQQSAGHKSNLEVSVHIFFLHDKYLQSKGYIYIYI